MSQITTTEDVPTCPKCDAPAVKDGLQDRHCNACGLAWKVVTAEDELDAEADRLVRSRGWNEEKGKSKKIGKFQARW
jgi:hypothetical protein